MATVTKGKTFANGEIVTPAKLHALVDDATVTNIVNADINASAAIALSKLATGALPAAITVASANIVDGTILNADINASAGIADTKLATISTAGKVANSATTATDTNTANAIVARDASGNFSAATITANLTGNASTVTTNANLTGDVTSVGNATSIASGVIVNADINASAAIADTKLATISTAGKVANSATTATNANTANTIVARDASGNFSAATITANLTGNVTGNLTGTASAIADNTVTSAKIVDGTIVNVDINASAAIALSKLATGALPAAITVASANIVDGTIATAKIADGAVTQAKLDGISNINQQTNNHTLVLLDAGRVIEMNSASALTVTIPANSTVNFGNGATIAITRRGAGEVTIAPAAGVTLQSVDSRLKIAKQYAAAACMKIATNEWLIVGNLKS